MVVGNEYGRSLEYTPTWAVACVATVFVSVSLLLANGIGRLEGWVREKRREPLLQALYKMKEELMLLGFISLLLTSFQNYVASICLKSAIHDLWTPCSFRSSPLSPETPQNSSGPVSSTTGRHRSLQQDSSLDPVEGQWIRLLSGGAHQLQKCDQGYKSFVSTEGVHQLHTFIFVMAVVHVAYTLLTMVLALMRVQSWKQWEDEAQSETHNSLEAITRELTLRRQATFVTYHTSKAWSRNRFSVWLVCFFRQFGPAITRCDYLTLRLGFINNHNTGLKFNFHSYMIRTMEDEFKSIVGISAPLWTLVVVFILFNVHGSNLYFWVSLIPVVVRYFPTLGFILRLLEAPGS